ncbi:MAG: TIGR01548 family HAD-type hydrolase [Nostochopsis sp.]
MNIIVIFDIDGVVRDVSGSYRRALADTVENFTQDEYRPTSVDIDQLKSEGIWNNDWEASQELIYRYFEAQGQPREQLGLDYKNIVAFFQARYRGTDPENFTGYICDEPLLLSPSYLDQLTLAGIVWGFFSGATRGSANYVLQSRLGLRSPVLIAMEDAPGKPDPTGLFATVRLLEDNIDKSSLIVYIGDTVADMYTVEKARRQDAGSRQTSLQSEKTWIGVGVLPPHVQETTARRDAYAETLRQAGATIVLNNVQELTPARILELVQQN